MTELRIYAACLASYNAGRLHGRWIDASSDAEEMQAEIIAMLRESPCPNVTVDCVECMGTGESFPGCLCQTCKGKGSVPSAEEWAFHDHEGFGSLVGEYTSLSTIAELVTTHDELGDDEWEAFIAYAEHVGGELPDVDDFRDAYCGTWDSFRDYAENFFDDVYGSEVPDFLSNYVDYDAFARDLSMDYFTEDASGGQVHVFRSN